MKKMLKNKSGLLSIVFLAAFLPAIAAPSGASKVTRSDIRSEYKYKKSKCSTVSVKEYKKYTGYNKYLNKPKKRG
ncbi:MAG: hypothetical protein RBR81_11710 [Bacteroidales bacterium]|jgi:hypothetical protein|nr:hypothetical protein [Bacteroidales bacterium]